MKKTSFYLIRILNWQASWNNRGGKMMAKFGLFSVGSSGSVTDGQRDKDL